MIEVRKTSHSVLPWRLFAEEPDGRRLAIPHTGCSTRQKALRLKVRLEGVADWGNRELWDAATCAAVREVLGSTESSRMQAEAIASWRR